MKRGFNYVVKNKKKTHGLVVMDEQKINELTEEIVREMTKKDINKQ